MQSLEFPVWMATLWQTKGLKRKEKTNIYSVKQISKLKPINVIKTNITTMENNQKV